MPGIRFLHPHHQSTITARHPPWQATTVLWHPTAPDSPQTDLTSPSPNNGPALLPPLTFPSPYACSDPDGYWCLWRPILWVCKSFHPYKYAWTCSSASPPPPPLPSPYALTCSALTPESFSVTVSSMWQGEDM